jgi:class 3 adenylate cyclase
MAFLRYIVVLAYTVILSVYMFVQSTLYFKSNITAPLRRLEEAMSITRTGILTVFYRWIGQTKSACSCPGSTVCFSGFRNANICGRFRKVTSAVVRDRLLAGSIELGGIRTVGTILFCDIRNFTTFTESMPPEEVIDFINSYLNEMVKPVINREGIIDKFIGDAIMAVFGPPSGYDDHAERAVTAAIEMLHKLAAFNDLRALKSHSPVHIGIGIHTGSFIAGNIGTTDRIEYTVLGDTVNTASRLEGLTKQFNTSLVISDATACRLSPEVASNFSKTETVSLRGRSEETVIRLYRK